MGKYLLGAILLVAAMGCTNDRACRSGTVMVTFDFLEGPSQIDGVALRYRLDGGATTDLKPVTRPTGTVPSTLELDIKDYAQHKQLLLQLAPRRGGEIVGGWRDQPIALDEGCTTVSVTVGIDVDGGDADGGRLDASISPLDAFGSTDLPQEVGVDLALKLDSPSSPSDSADLADPSPSDTPLLADSAVMPPDTFSPDRSADLSAGADARDSAADLAAPGVVLVHGALSTLGPREATSTIRLLREGFESSGTTCVKGLCVTGGIVP